MSGFRSLPAELRCRIWTFALGSGRTLALDVSLDAAVASQPTSSGRHVDYVIFGGSFHISRDTDMVATTRPIQNLSLVCWESRHLVVQLFPDIVIAQRTNEHCLVQRRRGLRTRFCRKPASPQARFAMRCSLDRDLFSFADIDVNFWTAQSNERYALVLYELFHLGRESPVTAQCFRQQLAAVRRAEYVKRHRLDRTASPATITCLHALLAGLQGLKAFYLATKSTRRGTSTNVADGVARCKGTFIDPALREAPLARIVGVVLAAGPGHHESSHSLLSAIDREGQAGIGWGEWTMPGDSDTVWEASRALATELARGGQPRPSLQAAQRRWRSPDETFVGGL
jgi:hypothetical protein